MNSKALIPLGASVFMGLIAAVLARQIIKSKGPAPEHTQSVRIVAAKAELPPGHALTADDLTLAPIAATTPPPNTSTDPARLVGRVIMAPLFAGQPILDSQLAAQGTPSGLQALVPDGMRAISLDTTESSGLLGLLMPGSRVDVVTTATSSNNAEQAVSRIIAQDVRVLAVGQRLAGNAHEADGQNAASRMVTLLVTPHDAAALDLAQTMARLRLILRGTSDREELDDDPVMMADLRGGAVAAQPAVMQSTTPAPAQPVVATTQPVTAPAQVAPAEAPHRIVTLILGNQEQRLSFREQSKPGDSELSDTKDPNEPNDPFANP